MRRWRLRWFISRSRARMRRQRTRRSEGMYSIRFKSTHPSKRIAPSTRPHSLSLFRLPSSTVNAHPTTFLFCLLSSHTTNTARLTIAHTSLHRHTQKHKYTLYCSFKKTRPQCVQQSRKAGTPWRPETGYCYTLLFLVSLIVSFFLVLAVIIEIGRAHHERPNGRV